MLDFQAHCREREAAHHGGPVRVWQKKLITGLKFVLCNFKEDSMKHSFALDQRLSESKGNSIIGYLTISNQEEWSKTKVVIAKESIGLALLTLAGEGVFYLFLAFAEWSCFYLCSDMISLWSCFSLSLVQLGKQSRSLA